MGKPKFRIGPREYEFPSAFRLGDPALIEEVTGLDFVAFSEAMDDPRNEKNPTILAGLVAVAIWQAEPQRKRRDVAAQVERLQITAIDVDAPEGDGRPPESGGTPD